MAIKDLAEGLTPGELWVSVWLDEESKEVFVQYGYVDISMPVEDFSSFIDVLVEAEDRLEGPGKNTKKRGDH